MANYRGRFAPSPTGPLHLGSLLAAAASYLRARQANGEWLLRIEDIDPPREMAGAADIFLKTLDEFGFEWDGDVVYQSTRFSSYRAALEQLKSSDSAFRCQCSRKDIRVAIQSTRGPDGVYPGTCQRHPPAENTDVNWRLATGNRHVVVNDLLQGPFTTHYGQDQGDFVVWRKDDLPSYQLAVSVDDLEQGITEVVRGIDLLQETPGQILLHQHLSEQQSHSQIAWMHLPILTDRHGNKLSKQTHATPVDGKNAAQHLSHVMSFLGLPSFTGMERAAVQDIWAYAIENWNPKGLYKRQILRLD